MSSQEPSLRGANVALDAVRCEYQFEHERNNTLNSRSGVYLSVLFGFVAFALPALDISKIHLAQLCSAPIILDVHLLFAAATALCMLMALLAMLCLSRSILTRNYSRLNYKDLGVELLAHAPEELAAALIAAYASALDKNVQINNKKARRYNRAIVYCLASLLMFFTAYCVQKMYL